MPIAPQCSVPRLRAFFLARRRETTNAEVPGFHSSSSRMLRWRTKAGSYSVRSARAGSTVAALREGRNPASTATAPMSRMPAA